MDPKDQQLRARSRAAARRKTFVLRKIRPLTGEAFIHRGASHLDPKFSVSAGTSKP